MRVAVGTLDQCRANIRSLHHTTIVASSLGRPGSHSQGGFWAPFTDHNRFRSRPKIFSSAKGIYYYDVDGRAILDGMSGLWCCHAGHSHPKIVEAIAKQAQTLDFSPTFNTSHESPSILAQKVLNLLPGRGFSEVFFTMCGSTAVDSALKIALQYYRSKGQGQRVRFIGRERGYHGVGFGGTSVGGILSNRKAFSGNMLPFIDHIPHTHSLSNMAFSKGEPEWGKHLAEELERVVSLHDASTIAAVIIEPVAGSTGVLPPPKGYLKRIREICSRHNILLIFDEVITGFGRVGKPFAAVEFDVTPDMITCAKGLTNGAVPAGAVICRSDIYNTIYSSAHPTTWSDQGSGVPDLSIELMHGYTYSGHPLAMAAGIAALDVFIDEDLFERSALLSKHFEKLLHSLKGFPHVVDIRNYGMMGAVELEPLLDQPTRRAMDIFDRCFDAGVLVRVTGSTVALSPPLVCERRDLEIIIETLGNAIKESANSL